MEQVRTLHALWLIERLLPWRTYGSPEEDMRELKRYASNLNRLTPKNVKIASNLKFAEFLELIGKLEPEGLGDVREAEEIIENDHYQQLSALRWRVKRLCAHYRKIHLLRLMEHYVEEERKLQAEREAEPALTFVPRLTQSVIMGIQADQPALGLRPKLRAIKRNKKAIGYILLAVLLDDNSVGSRKRLRQDPKLIQQLLRARVLEPCRIFQQRYGSYYARVGRVFQKSQRDEQPQGEQAELLYTSIAFHVFSSKLKSELALEQILRVLGLAQLSPSSPIELSSKASDTDTFDDDDDQDFDDQETAGPAAEDEETTWLQQ